MIETLAAILQLPNLDDETIRLVNGKLREAIEKLEATPAQSIHGVMPPPGMDQTTFSEWINGAVKKEE